METIQQPAQEATQQARLEIRLNVRLKEFSAWCREHRLRYDLITVSSELPMCMMGVVEQHFLLIQALGRCSAPMKAIALHVGKLLHYCLRVYDIAGEDFTDEWGLPVLKKERTEAIEQPIEYFDMRPCVEQFINRRFDELVERLRKEVMYFSAFSKFMLQPDCSDLHNHHDWGKAVQLIVALSLAIAEKYNYDFDTIVEMHQSSWDSDRLLVFEED